MMDEEQIKRIQYKRDLDDVIYNYNSKNILKGYYEEVMQERKKQKQLTKRIIVLSVLCVTFLLFAITQLNTIEQWETKMIHLKLKYGSVFENPFNLK